MGMVNRAEAIDVTDWAKTDPNNRLPQSYIDAGLTLNTIYINGVRFDGISRDSSLGWEEFVWAKEPTRSNAFAFENMDTIDVGLVAQCQVNFKYFNIEDFIKFREAIKQRYFRCTFFNVDTCQWEVDREMYCSKSQRDKLYYFNPKLVGVLDFNITLVATNRDIIEHDAIQINYHTNGYDIVVPSEPIIVGYSEQYYVDNGPKEPSGREFLYWTDRVDEKGKAIGWQFKEGESFTAFKSIDLYAIYKEV